jgi:hypothetical protein
LQTAQPGDTVSAVKGFAAVLCVAFTPACGWACSCAPPPPNASPGSQALCNRLTNADGNAAAVFVGVVSEVYPSSLKERIALYRDKKDPAGTIRWPKPKRVRLRVLEPFVNAPGERFELFTGWDGGDCGIPFEAGQTYLVFAHRDRWDRGWITTICSGTVAASYAGQDIRTLRAWRAGVSLAPRIYGAVHAGEHYDPARNVEVRLTGSEVMRSTFTDADGRFLFDDLPAGRYRVAVTASGWRLSVMGARGEIDLIANRCAELSLYLEAAPNP